MTLAPNNLVCTSETDNHHLSVNVLVVSNESVSSPSFFSSPGNINFVFVEVTTTFCLATLTNMCNKGDKTKSQAERCLDSASIAMLPRAAKSNIMEWFLFPILSLVPLLVPLLPLLVVPVVVPVVPVVPVVASLLFVI